MTRLRRFQVAPRFTCGSPTQVSWDIACHVVEQEKSGYQRALTGVMGDEDKVKAEREGLKFIVFEMRETTGGWLVKDLITNECWRWPHKVECPVCHEKNVRCKRGYVQEHHWPRGKGDTRFIPCDHRGYVGILLPAEDRW